MKILLNLCFLFFIGSSFGYILEVLYRRFFSAKKWINPGFLIGPYIPLYGFGLIIYYLISNINLAFINNIIIKYIVLIIIMALAATILEYLIGLLSIKIAHVKLWDYSNQPFNINGIICPLFTLFWGIIGAFYLIVINPIIDTSLNWLSNNLAFSFFIGFFFGVFVIDLCYSIKLIDKVKKFAQENNIIIKYEQLKLEVKEQMIIAKEKYHFLFPLSIKDLKEKMNKYKEKIEMIKASIDDDYEL